MAFDYRFKDEEDAITYVFSSLARTNWRERGLDENTRSTAPTVQLIRRLGLLDERLIGERRDYAVVTGSKGKGSVTMITARVLRELGHTVGTITSPQLVSYRERIRVNGRAIPLDDLLRILDAIAPEIDAVQATLTGEQYLSPQGIFLAIALRWFDEQEVGAAVLEVGRGGRFDDIAVVPNRVAMFTPMVLEHTRYLGATIDRIAWHKAGIIKERGYALSVAQAPEVLAVLQAEADAKDAEFVWLSNKDSGEYLGDTPNGLRMRLGRYGELNLSLMGRYEIENAALSVQAAGNMHGFLGGISHASDEYVQRVRGALADVRWPGRCHLLQENPTVFVDGAVNTLSLRSFLASVRSRITPPVVVITAVPRDRDYPAIYAELASVTDTLILTESARNITIFFPNRETALAAAEPYFREVQHTTTLAEAVEIAKGKVGSEGTILMALAQPAVGDAMALWGLTFEQL